MLDQVKNLLSEKSSLESELRVCESVTQQWMTNQVHATLAPNTCKQTPASTSIWGSSVLIPDWFRIRGTSKWPLAHLEAVASLSDHATFWQIKATKPSTMLSPSSSLWNDTLNLQSKPWDGLAQQVGVSKQCYNQQATQQSGRCIFPQWVPPSKGSPFAQSWKSSIMRPISWTWSSASWRNSA